MPKTHKKHAKIKPRVGKQDCNSWQGVSTQQQLDCCSYTESGSESNQLVNDLNPYDTHGCNGGYSSNAMRCIMMQGGINNWADYGYTEQQGSCAYDAETATLNPMSSCALLEVGDEVQLAQAVAQVGPIAIGMDASGLGMMLYSGGVYSSTSCSSSSLNHAVAAVGYGDSSGVNYWEVKNSWGTDWGIDGYILVAKDKDNMCGIASDSTYVVA